MQPKDDVCVCCMDVRRKRHRDFSSQIWALLLSWEEVPEEAIDQPMCAPCYEEIRAVLIERAEEVEMALEAGNSADSQSIDAGSRANMASHVDSGRLDKKADKVSKIAS